jgi:hypothetical protein
LLWKGSDDYDYDSDDSDRPRTYYNYRMPFQGNPPSSEEAPSMAGRINPSKRWQIFQNLRWGWKGFKKYRMACPIFGENEMEQTGWQGNNACRRQWFYICCSGLKGFRHVNSTLLFRQASCKWFDTGVFDEWLVVTDGLIKRCLLPVPDKKRQTQFWDVCQRNCPFLRVCLWLSGSITCNAYLTTTEITNWLLPVGIHVPSFSTVKKVQHNSAETIMKCAHIFYWKFLKKLYMNPSFSSHQKTAHQAQKITQKPLLRHIFLYTQNVEVSVSKFDAK